MRDQLLLTPAYRRPALARRLLEAAAAHPERLVLDVDRLFFTDLASARALDRACKALEQQVPAGR